VKSPRKVKQQAHKAVYRCEIVSTHKLEEAINEVWGHLHQSVLRIVRMDIDGCQFVDSIPWVDELVFVDEPDSTSGSVVIFNQLYVSPNVLHQSPVHIPRLDHTPVDRQSHALVVKSVQFLDYVYHVTLPVICEL
jgi:hypothetical protein